MPKRTALTIRSLSVEDCRVFVSLSKHQKPNLQGVWHFSLLQYLWLIHTKFIINCQLTIHPHVAIIVRCASFSFSCFACFMFKSSNHRSSGKQRRRQPQKPRGELFIFGGEEVHYLIHFDICWWSVKGSKATWGNSRVNQRSFEHDTERSFAKKKKH